MDILTYALARKGGGSGDGALTGLTDVQVTDDGFLQFFIEGKEKPIQSSTAIPGATVEQIKSAIENNPNAVKTAIGIPLDVNNDDIADVLHNAVTQITVGDIIDPETNQPLVLNNTDHTLNLPLASGDMPGLVKGVSGSDFDPETYDPEDPKTINKENINKIYINNDGTMSVYALNMNRLVQTEGDEFIMGDID